MSSTGRKRQRPERLSEVLAYATQSDLAKILAAVRQDPRLRDGGIGRSTLNRMHLEGLGNLKQTITMETTDGNTFDWVFLHPGRLLQRWLRHPKLQKFWAERLRAEGAPSQEKPWNLIFGFDEFTPGDKLRADNRRKTMILNYSFTEMGCLNLPKQSLWITPVAIRADRLGKIKG